MAGLWGLTWAEHHQREVDDIVRKIQEAHKVIAGGRSNFAAASQFKVGEQVTWQFCKSTYTGLVVEVFSPSGMAKVSDSNGNFWYVSGEQASVVTQPTPLVCARPACRGKSQNHDARTCWSCGGPLERTHG